MKTLKIILPSKPSPLLQKMINAAVLDNDFEIISGIEDLKDLKNKKILFAVELNQIGINSNLNAILEKLTDIGNDSLSGSRGAILIHSKYNNYTKTAAADIIYIANKLACEFPGRPAIEANANLDNYQALQNIYKLSLEEICLQKSSELGRRLLSDQDYFKNKSISLLHSSNTQTSNTYELWKKVKVHLDDFEIREVYLGNGSIPDCRGCSYKTCKHFGKQSRCFYGGIVEEEVYPAIINSSTIILLCPNYNDMLAANIVATINRLTALFRQTKFYDKKIFSLIVSGYSGGDALAKQLISSLNMNKTFELAPNFSLQVTANDSGYINKIPGIDHTAKEFADHIKKTYSYLPNS